MELDSGRPALVDYLRHGRPGSSNRHGFFRAVAPQQPISRVAVSTCARRYLLKPGSRFPARGRTRYGTPASSGLWTLIFGFKTIGDFVGHRSPASAESYAKVAVQPLCQVALGDGEQVLA